MKRGIPAVACVVVAVAVLLGTAHFAWEWMTASPRGVVEHPREVPMGPGLTPDFMGLKIAEQKSRIIRQQQMDSTLPPPQPAHQSGINSSPLLPEQTDVIQQGITSAADPGR